MKLCLSSCVCIHICMSVLYKFMYVCIYVYLLHVCMHVCTTCCLPTYLSITPNTHTRPTSHLSSSRHTNTICPCLLLPASGLMAWKEVKEGTQDRVRSLCIAKTRLPDDLGGWGKLRGQPWVRQNYWVCSCKFSWPSSVIERVRGEEAGGWVRYSFDIYEPKYFCTSFCFI